MTEELTIFKKGNEHLPEGWNWSLLDKVADVVAGNPAPQGEQFFENGTYPFVRVQDMGRLGLQKRINQTNDYINDKAIEKLKLIPKGSVLFTKSGASTLLNQRAVLGSDMYVVSHIAAAIPHDGIISEWLFYWLKTVDFNYIAHATTLPSLPLSKARGIPVPVAPTNEQKHIVAEIEKQFSRLDEAVENLKRVKANLKRYKASVLKAAVEGRLINTTKENTSFHIINWKPIELALVSLDQGWSPKCDRLQANEREWGVIKTSAVQALQYIEWENKRLPDPLEPKQHLELQKNDLLVTRAGPRKRVGVCCLVRYTRSKLILCDKVYRLRCNYEVARPGYLELALNAPQIKEAINELKTGISDSGVNLTQKRFKALRVPLPSVELQMQIESEVQRLWSIVDQVTLNTTEGSARCHRLRQSILKKAFSGKLVAQVENDEFLVSSLM